MPDWNPENMVHLTPYLIVRDAADRLCATAVHRQARRSPIAAAAGGEKQGLPVL